MKILQLHVDFIEYKPVKKEIPGAEDATTDAVKEEDLVVLFTAVESGDDTELAKKAVSETKEFLGKLGTSKVMIYPFAHLSQDLARPADALPVLKDMETEAKGAGLEVSRAPFGWNKALQLKVKGHPLAEMSRSYSREPGKQAAAPAKRAREPTESEAMAKLKRSDFGGLPDGDHRTIGQRQDLFSLQEVSPGMVYWHDKGLKLWNVIEGFIRSELSRRGYIEVSTPALANTALWRVSGHSEHYRDNMFLTSLGGEELGMKPMNCPSHFLIYKTRRWSFRELPVRYSTFDPLYRNELSGVASGLFRVKVLTQDDGHIIATEEQAEKELADMLDLMVKVYGVFGLEYKVKISTRPDDSMGTDEEWERATNTLIRVVKSKGWAYEIKEKEGNFYSPKIDVDIRDSLGREWQCGTFQFDLQMPKRFKLTYTGSDGKEHTPVVLHRTILGSMERFIGIMLEHYKGALPVWLSPVQVKVIPLSDDHRAYAEKVLGSLVEAGIRAEGDLASGTMGAKIRDAQLLKVPYMLVVGKKEEDAKTVAVRTREGEQRFGIQLADFLSEVKEKVASFK
ncbi:MAG TPA: threonine--tRNA ligase [Nitrososphaerales archaeon]|nr:threonine--tRNA ligase [Nitrososphaerales archaeon]